MRPRTQKQPQVKKEPYQMLDDVDVDAEQKEKNQLSLSVINMHQNLIMIILMTTLLQYSPPPLRELPTNDNNY